MPLKPRLSNKPAKPGVEEHNRAVWPALPLVLLASCPDQTNALIRSLRVRACNHNHLIFLAAVLKSSSSSSSSGISDEAGAKCILKHTILVHTHSWSLLNLKA